MSGTIDINANKAQVAEDGGPKGGRSRFLFTLAITTAICLALLAFLWLLGRSTEDPGPRLNIEQRSAIQVYMDATAIAEKPLRLRALRNFTSAYPDSPKISEAETRISELEADEYQQWLNLSDVVYNIKAKKAAKLEAAQTFESEWGTGKYSEDLKTLLLKLESQTTKPRTLAKDNSKIAALAGNIEGDKGAQVQEEMAGGPVEIEIFKPAATLPMAPPEPVAIIIQPTIKKNVSPSYPSRAQSRGIEAIVTVSMDIGADGKVKDARVVKPATGRYANDFGRAALRAAKRTRFNPKTVDGKAEPTNGFTRRYRFEMKSKKKKN